MDDSTDRIYDIIDIIVQAEEKPDDLLDCPACGGSKSLEWESSGFLKIANRKHSVSSCIVETVMNSLILMGQTSQDGLKNDELEHDVY